MREIQRNQFAEIILKYFSFTCMQECFTNNIFAKAKRVLKKRGSVWTQGIANRPQLSGRTDNRGKIIYESQQSPQISMLI